MAGLVVAQIGCGIFGTQEHGRHAVKNEHISRIKWACDVHEDSARNYAKIHGAENVTTSFEDVTTDPEVDVIFIATSNEARVPVIESAAANGKHMFCEKPMAMDEYGAYRIIKAVRNSGVKFCVDYMRRTAPAVVALKREWLAHKANPKRNPWRYVEVPDRELMFEEKTTDFLVRVQDESSTFRMVHLDAFRGAGMIISEAVHWLDLSCWLFENDRPVEILAWGSSRIKWGINVKFLSGNTATMIMTPNGTFDYTKEFYEIACDGALFRMEHYVENQYLGRPGVERELFPLERDPLPEVGKQGGLSGLLEKYRANVKNVKNAKAVWPNLMPDHGYRKMFDTFVDAVVNDKPVVCNVMDGYRATYLGQLACKSIELNKPLPVPVDKWEYIIA